jgi:hypothetical protein
MPGFPTGIGASLEKEQEGEHDHSGQQAEGQTEGEASPTAGARDRLM